MARGAKTGGRKAGTPNKVTSDVRQVIADFANAKAPEFVTWIDRVAESNPEKAADLYLKAIEYHIPKLARTELTGQDGKDIGVAINVNFGR